MKTRLIGTTLLIALTITINAYSQSAIPVNLIKVQDGFRVELLHSVKPDEGSWVSLTHDDKGRLITSDQYGGLFRITPPPIGSSAGIQIEKLDVEMGHAQGLLYAFDSLYAVVNGKPFGKGPGLYRLRDTDQDDQFDEVKLLRPINGGGEHGPHAVILSPDGKSLYVCGGNHTDIPNPEKSRVPRNWSEDQLLPRMWDAGGHAVGKLAPGGWICRTDPEGKTWELVSSGYRNEYDIAFNLEGDLFTYDADMEWDIGSPWYRPTRVCFASSGSEFGWRSGTGKWPPYYPDSLPPAVDIGPGSPTGVTFGTGAKFPQKYQRAFFICDWSYGLIYAVHLKQAGGGYTGTFERFCSAPALQGTDITVAPDGAMYFTIGGRRTQSGLYRITYVGQESTEPAKPLRINETAQLRRRIEKLHFPGAKGAVELGLENIGHSDRFVRYAARVAMEHQPVELWRDQVLNLDSPTALINGMVAFARCAKPSSDNLMAGVNALAQLDADKLSEAQLLEMIRAYGLLLIRLKVTPGAENEIIARELNHLFPAKSEALNLELSRILIAVEAPDIVARVIRQLKTAPSQKEQIHYALCLRVAKKGWNAKHRTDYFEWFLKAASLQGGHSFSGFLANIRKEAIGNMTPEERESFKELLARKPETTDPYAELKARPFVKKWTVDDLLDDVNNGLKDRDLENGRKMFGVAQCYKCHRINQQGGIVGPDLTGLGRRYNNRDLLESLINPSRTVSDQYQATMFMLDNGKTVVGRVANLNGKNYRVIEDMLKPGVFTNVNVDQIEAMKPAPKSMMPEGLLDNLTKDEILDLVAFLKSSVGPDVSLGSSAGGNRNEAKQGAGNGAGEKKKISANERSAGSDSPSAFRPRRTRAGNGQISRPTRASTRIVRRAPQASAVPSETQPPNILFIISDDQSWTDYGFMGHKVIQTPHLDRLAKESFTFTRGYVPTSLCRPSLMTMITGLYPRQHHVTGNDPGVPDGADRGKYRRTPGFQKLRDRLIANVDKHPTLPKLLASQGYLSFQCGKWWEGNYRRGGFTHGMTHGDPKKGGRHGDEGLKIGRQGLGPVREFLDTAGNKPFFIWYAPFMPHSPHNPPERLLKKYRNLTPHLELAKYYAMCEWFDETCGELLGELKKRDLERNTLVIYVTDNGWIQRTRETKVPQGYRTGFAPKSKQTPFDTGVRTPIMIKWPGGGVQQNFDEQTLVSSIDMMPTALAAAGIKVPENLPGVNLLPVCQGKQELDRDAIFGEIYAHDVADLDDPSQTLLYEWCISGFKKIIKTYPGKIGPYRAVHQTVPKGTYCYDLKADPFEEHPLKTVPQDLEEKLDQWRKRLATNVAGD